MKKTIYYLLSTFLPFISSMQGAAFIEGDADERIIRAVSVLDPSIHDEDFKHTQRIYANQTEELETILIQLEELKDVHPSIQPLVVIHVACIDNASDLEYVVDSWCQVNDIQDKALRTLAINCMTQADSLEDIDNVGNAWDTLDKIEDHEIQLEALFRMLAARSTEAMNKIAEQAKAYEQIIRTVSVLTPSIHDEALKHTQRIYANQPQKLKTILSLLEELKDIDTSIQPLVVMHVACIDNASDMEYVVYSWCQVNGIENKELRMLAINFMKKAGSLGDINNIGNAWDTLGNIEDPSLQLEALNIMLLATSTEAMNEIAEQARAHDDVAPDETSDVEIA